ncbi:HD domain-containing protein [Streptomyces sp. KS 21]|uniref:HD domain-containing protein n=1 Tax=Streptomyces sp. KS 21 TaxID=2485150 RepID=UPI0026966EBA
MPLANAHPAVRTRVQGAVDEYEAGETPEAIVARDADKLECLVQAVEYREQGYSLTQNWIDTSLASRKTPSAKALANAALSMSSLDWQKNFLPS